MLLLLLLLADAVHAWWVPSILVFRLGGPPAGR